MGIHSNADVASTIRHLQVPDGQCVVSAYCGAGWQWLAVSAHPLYAEWFMAAGTTLQGDGGTHRLGGAPGGD